MVNRALRNYIIISALLFCAGIVLSMPTTGAAQGDVTPTHHPVEHPTQHGTQHAPVGEATVTPSSGAVATTADIAVDGNVRYQTMLGFGGALAPVEWVGNYNRHNNAIPVNLSNTTDDLTGIAKLLFQQVGLTHVRLFLSEYEPQNDNADPQTLDPSVFTWKPNVDPQINFVKVAQPQGLQWWWLTFSADGGKTEQWFRQPNSVCQFDSSKVDEYVEWLLAAALHFKEANEVPRFMTIANEPDFGYCTDPVSQKFSVDDYVKIVKGIGARLKQAGIQTQLVIPDALNPQGALAYVQAVLNDADARQYVGALAYHSYADAYPNPTETLRTSGQGQPLQSAVESRQKIAALAAQYKLSVWMTEVCVCTPTGDSFSAFELGRARLNHVVDELTIGNVSVFDVMNAYFIERPNVRDELVEVTFNPDGSMASYKLATYGSLIAHYARYVPMDSTRISATTTDPRVRPVTFMLPSGGIAIVLLNNNANEVNTAITLSNLNLSAPLSVVTSREGALWQSAPQVSAQNGRLELTLTPLSVTTLYTAP